MVNIMELLQRMRDDPFMMVPHYEVEQLAQECARYRSEMPVGYIVAAPSLQQPHFVTTESEARRLAGIIGLHATVTEVTPRRTILCNVIDEKEVKNEN